MTEERVESKSISLNNVRKERTNSESRIDFWDIENFSTGFSYSERKSSNITTQLIETKEHRGNFAYNFSPKNISFQPFKSIKWLDSKIFKIIQSFHFFGITFSRMIFACFVCVF